MTSYALSYTHEKNPMVDYAVKNMWGNPELDSQHQVKLARISGKPGYINNFTYLGKNRPLPTALTRYHLFSLGGLDVGFWNIGGRGKSWYPIDTWVPSSTFSKTRAVALDFYLSTGELFPRDLVYIMNCFDGVTYIAIPFNNNFEIPLGKNFYMHCYTTDINTNNISEENKIKHQFNYNGKVYLEPADFRTVQLSYNTWKGYNIGTVTFIHNGVIKPIDSVTPKAGDLIEVVYDPSIEMVITYDYKNMPDYLSTKDNKRKVILFPGFIEKPHKYYFYDDCHYYVTNKRNGNSYYYHRNSEDAVRQLTHQDYGMAVDYIELLAAKLINADTTNQSKMSDIQITVAYHATTWKFKLGPTSSRINDLYLLEKPDQILMAMTGSNSNIPEWTADRLEGSYTNALLHSRFLSIDTESVRNALGYNGCAVAMSNTPLYMPYIPPGDPNFVDIGYPTAPYTSGLGYKIPPTYVESSTAYEYDVNGLLLRKVGVQNQEWYSPMPGAAIVEWVLGQASTWLDYVITKSPVPLREGFSFKVFKSPWIIDVDYVKPLNVVEFPITTNGSSVSENGIEVRVRALDDTDVDLPLDQVPSGGYPSGAWTEITDTSDYSVVDGTIIWNIDMTNWVGMVVFESYFLYNEFNLTHIDNSLSFAITYKWPVGGVLLPYEPGQIDIWMNRHPLIENVDYILDFPNVYIINKMWLKEGAQFFQYRCTGFSKRGLIRTSELGFVSDGVIGYNGRYNLRIDRPTKVICGGRLYMTPTVDSAEDIDHKDNMKLLNGFPYEVKHIYTPNKYVDEVDMYWNYDEAKELDKRISNYLTEHVEYKSDVPPKLPFMERDKYRLYSPFLNQIVNELVLGFMDVPTPSGNPIPYPDQTVDDITREYQWMLKYDPILLDFDLRFFTVHPYNSKAMFALTPDQLTFVKRVNDIYLKGKVVIEGHFEVKHV